MKKFIVVMTMLIICSTIPIFGYESADSYVCKLNDSVGEMRMELSEKEEVSILKGINEGYLKPSIANDENLRNAMADLSKELKKERISNQQLNEKNLQLVTTIEETISLLDDTIFYKKELLNSDENTLSKMQKLIFEDDKKVELVNNKIEEINKIYEEINQFI